jgi:hypothetical protein
MAGSESLQATWRQVASTVYSPRILEGLPKYAEQIARTFWDVEVPQVTAAMRCGDVPFFIAALIRIDIIDAAMIDLGRTLADRAPLIRCRWIVDGFRQVAEESLRKAGGRWPPTSASDEPPV